MGIGDVVPNLSVNADPLQGRCAPLTRRVTFNVRPHMTLTELLITSIPLIIALGIAILVIRKTGAFEQRAHRQRVEQLLERIAQAVEKKS